MGTEAERQDTRKAMAFDLFNLIDENAKGGQDRVHPRRAEKADRGLYRHGGSK